VLQQHAPLTRPARGGGGGEASPTWASRTKESPVNNLKIYDVVLELVRKLAPRLPVLKALICVVATMV
jgi:hypothetical protein